MKKMLFAVPLAFLAIYACNTSENKTASSDSITTTRKLEHDELVARGKYLVTGAGCADCHSPKMMTPTGPTMDTTKILSGHPANSPLPPVDKRALQPGNWAGMAPDATAFAGPWGISYASNLTPDSATGLGAWTEEIFIKTLRTGKHLGADNGRPILPPMPWYATNKFNDEDLGAIFQYLKSLPAVSNRVPAPTPPTEVKL